VPNNSSALDLPLGGAGGADRGGGAGAGTADGGAVLAGGELAAGWGADGAFPLRSSRIRALIPILACVTYRSNLASFLWRKIAFWSGSGELGGHAWACAKRGLTVAAHCSYENPGIAFGRW